MEQVQISYLDYIISSDKTLLQIFDVHSFLSTESYWSKNIPKQTVEKAIENSFCIGVYFDSKQVGFARIISDYATFGYLADVYILQEHRGKGISKAMMKAILALDWVKGLRRFTLATLDAQGLYSQFGFFCPKNPERLMEISKPGIYGDLTNPCKA